MEGARELKRQCVSGRREVVQDTNDARNLSCMYFGNDMGLSNVWTPRQLTSSTGAFFTALGVREHGALPGQYYGRKVVVRAIHGKFFISPTFQNEQSADTAIPFRFIVGRTRTPYAASLGLTVSEYVDCFDNNGALFSAGSSLAQYVNAYWGFANPQRAGISEILYDKFLLLPPIGVGGAQDPTLSLNTVGSYKDLQIEFHLDVWLEQINDVAPNNPDLDIVQVYFYALDPPANVHPCYWMTGTLRFDYEELVTDD